MYRVTKEDMISASHHLRNYQGKCEHVHGHNWKIKVTVEGEKLDDGGMLVDFHQIKNSMKQVLERLDHKDLNEIPPFTEKEPSAENIARYICIEVGKLINTANAKVKQVEVWETPSSCATYIEQ